ncbi:hypothetical protein MAHJHV57_51940 [Mycobacterium avium subsp. hominissuis]
MRALALLAGGRPMMRGRNPYIGSENSSSCAPGVPLAGLPGAHEDEFSEPKPW